MTMPLAAYCKKCKTEIPVDEVCSLCGGKLTKNAVRFSFRYHHIRWRDWNCWNSLLRIGGPVWLLVCAGAAVMEVLAGGWLALGQLITSPTGLALACVALLAVLLAGFCLAAAGSETQYFFLDAKGVNLCTYLNRPNAMKLLLRGISPRKLQDSQDSDGFGLYLSERHLAWSDIKRVQIWHDKNRILLYAPSWWMQMAVNCPPDEYEEAIAYVLGKLGKRKDVKIQHTPAGHSA